MLRITKICFPMVTVVRMENGHSEPVYYTVDKGGKVYPCEEIVTEEDWKAGLREAKEKGARIEEVRFGKD